VFAKRSIDLLLAATALVITSPFLIGAGIAVRVSTPGPALFRQTRVGLSGAPFVILKFRTMYLDGDDSEHRAIVERQLNGSTQPTSESGVFKLTNDVRVTRLGRILRRTSIDELPQLLNVLRGDMSLVGPRPSLPWEVALFRPEHLARFSVKPGITGLWQVSGRSRMTFAQALDLDVQYVQRRSLRMDAAILLKTIPAVVSRRGAW
jgi:Sugar transferases involved in lipopolysaccharide synthesis